MGSLPCNLRCGGEIMCSTIGYDSRRVTLRVAGEKSAIQWQRQACCTDLVWMVDCEVLGNSPADLFVLRVLILDFLLLVVEKQEEEKQGMAKEEGI